MTYRFRTQLLALVLAYPSLSHHRNVHHPKITPVMISWKIAAIRVASPQFAAGSARVAGCGGGAGRAAAIVEPPVTRPHRHRVPAVRPL